MSAPSTVGPGPGRAAINARFRRLGDFLRAHKSWQYAIIGLIIASGVAGLAWYYTVGERSAISVSTVSYDIRDPHRATLTFDVTGPTDYRVSCDVQAVSEDSVVVGHVDNVPVTRKPGAGRTVRMTVTVPTTEKPTTVQVSQCVKV